MTAMGFFGTFVFVPVVDGTFIVERPTVTLNNKKFNGVRRDYHSTRKLSLTIHIRTYSWQ